MPCDGSHLEPTGREVASSRVRELLREVDGKAFDHGRPKEFYGKPEELDVDTERLCVWCHQHSEIIVRSSLELQIWWRDHQAADRRREQDEATRALERQQREAAIAKLTPEEQAVLGLKMNWAP